MSHPSDASAVALMRTDLHPTAGVTFCNVDGIACVRGPLGQRLRLGLVRVKVDGGNFLVEIDFNSGYA